MGILKCSSYAREVQHSARLAALWLTKAGQVSYQLLLENRLLQQHFICQISCTIRAGPCAEQKGAETLLHVRSQLATSQRDQHSSIVACDSTASRTTAQSAGPQHSQQDHSMSVPAKVVKPRLKMLLTSGTQTCLLILKLVKILSNLSVTCI